MTQELRNAEERGLFRYREPISGVGVLAPLVSWAGLALPLVACAAIWGSGGRSPANVAWLSLAHGVIGSMATAWTVTRFIFRRAAQRRLITRAGKTASAGLLLLYGPLCLQPVLALAGSMLHGGHPTLFGIPIPTLLAVDQEAAFELDRVHGWNAILLLGLLAIQLARAFRKQAGLAAHGSA